MQPNQGNNVPNRLVVTRRPVNARPTTSATARVPEDAGPTFDNGPSIVGSKGGRKTGWVLAIILLLLIAAGGVGFGVWAWMDGNAQKNTLNEQISNLKKQNNELQNENTTLKENIKVYESAMSKNARVTILEIDETKSLDRDGAKAEIIDEKFYIKDSNGEEIIHDDVTVVTEIISCESKSVENDSPLTCKVSTPYGQGKFTYTYEQGYDVLNYTLDSWLDSFDVEETSDDTYVINSR